MKKVICKWPVIKQEVKIFAIGETGERRQIYCGILEDMKIMHENSLCLMEIRIVPYTYLLDLKPIFAIGETGERRQIYCGILEDMKIMHENSLCLMEIRIVPYTYLLDLKPQRRSFQIPAMAYQEVLDCIAKSYAGGNILMNIGTGEAIGEPIVQYQETDWAFIKRLASHFHAVVVPSYATSGDGRAQADLLRYFGGHEDHA